MMKKNNTEGENRLVILSGRMMEGCSEEDIMGRDLTK